MPDTARAAVEVTAGLLPGHPDSEHTRRWTITAGEWELMDPRQQSVALAELNGRGMGYAALLMLSPDRVNWVRTDWLWM